jgi:endonuclease/exonuclease/phosphatase (EEP) superfamily protein YafD
MVWNILFLITAAAGAFTVLGFFAKLWWPLDMLDHFRVQYLFILAAIGLILLLGGKSIPAMAAFSIALINLLVIIPIYFSPKNRSSIHGEIYRLLLVNVLCQNKRIVQVGELIKSESPDIILLLEPDEYWLRELKEYLDEYAYTCSQPRGDNYGIAFFSRLPVDNSEVHYFGELQIPSIEALIKFPDIDLSFIGTHLTPPKGRLNTYYRTRQLEDLSQHVNRNQYAGMICGDFNLTPWSVYFRNFTKESGLLDSTKGFGFQPTWPTWLAPIRIPIDHCLVSPGIKIINRKSGSRIGSDHLPVVIDFSV